MEGRGHYAERVKQDFDRITSAIGVFQTLVDVIMFYSVFYLLVIVFYSPPSGYTPHQ